MKRTPSTPLQNNNHKLTLKRFDIEPMNLGAMREKSPSVDLQLCQVSKLVEERQNYELDTKFTIAKDIPLLYL